MTTPTHDDRDMDDAVHSWLHENDEPTPDRNRHIGRVMGRVDETKRRRRLWPLNPFGRRAMHRASGADRAAPFGIGRTSRLAPVRVVTAVAMALLVTTALVWVAGRPQEPVSLPAGWWGDIDPVDEALFERMNASTWLGSDSSLSATREVYAEDAVHTALWLDEAVQYEGDHAIWSGMVQSDRFDRSDTERIRLPDHFLGAHRYLTYSPSTGHAACVVWMEDGQVSRHACILPMSFADGEGPMTHGAPAATTLASVDPSAVAAREALESTLLQASGLLDRELLAQVVSPSIVHHVRSDNQHYALEGLDEYRLVWGAPGILANVDLPAPEGELRWANFSTIGGGSLCDFWARDGLIVRQDCVAPGPTTIGSQYLDPIDG